MNRDEKTGIIYKKWEHPSPRAVFLLVHGLGAFSGRWHSLADFFLQHSITSYAIDLQGFGVTPGPKGHVDSFETYFDDIQALAAIIRKENSGKKVFLVGESMGGLVSFWLSARNPALWDGLICLVPAFGSRLKFSLLWYMKLFFLLLFDPERQLSMPFDAAMCTRDVACQKEIDTDERGHRVATPRLLFNILLAGRRAGSLKGKIKAPTLFLVAGDRDALTDSNAAQEIFDGLKTQDKTIIRYPEMFHSLSMELGREKVFGDILKWVTERR